MDRTINVAEFWLGTLRRWRDTHSSEHEQVPILRKVRLRGSHAIAIICGDDRMCCDSISHLTSLCYDGSFWPITIAGGALDLTASNPALAAYQTVILREAEKFFAAKEVPRDAPVDVLALGHVDCGFARTYNMDPIAQIETLYLAELVLRQLFSDSRFKVKTGFHMFWDGKHRTYELDAFAASSELAFLSG